MKLTETHFIDYLNKKKIHHEPTINEAKVNNLNNLIIYGAPGVGKYTYALNIIKEFSLSELKYEKKINITNNITANNNKNNKNNFFFKLSDIHYEVDMSLIGCNSKQLWNDIYLQIVDIIYAKQNKIGIILCTNFNSIHSELLDIFYSYMQTSFNNNIVIRFIIITTDISFLPDNIINCCEKIILKRPSKTVYNTTFNINIEPNFNINKITNIKDVKDVKTVKNETQESYESPYNNIMQTSHFSLSNLMLNCIINYNELNFLELRETLYEICIYDINIYLCINHIIHQLIEKKLLTSEKLNKVLVKLIDFLKLYNNNYRPIYHLESIMFYFITKVHNYES
jgi:DNA polymerase III delta prime subunit